MKLNELTIEEYSSLLASKKSTPGGGSALALVLEIACDLGIMVANFTIDKTGYESYKTEVENIKEQLINAKKTANRLINEDADAYMLVMQAYKSKNKEEINKASLFACEVPYQLFMTSKDVEMLCYRLYEIGNKNLISDAKIGYTLCQSVYPGCLDNIRCNIDGIINHKDKVKYLEVLE